MGTRQNFFLIFCLSVRFYLYVCFLSRIGSGSLRQKTTNRPNVRIAALPAHKHYLAPTQLKPAGLSRRAPIKACRSHINRLTKNTRPCKIGTIAVPSPEHCSAEPPLLRQSFELSKFVCESRNVIQTHIIELRKSNGKLKGYLALTLLIIGICCFVHSENRNKIVLCEIGIFS